MGGRLPARFGTVVTLCLLLTGFLSRVHAAAWIDSLPRQFPEFRLGRAMRGEMAVQALGDRLAEVAGAHRMNPEGLRQMLRRDTSLAVDEAGRLHYTDEPLPADLSLEGTPAAGAAEGLIPLTVSATFSLHSKLGAKRTIYLDFDGHLLSGTVWNSRYNGGANLTAPAWDLDGNPLAWNETELGRIQNIWQRVAEDFAPFDVDVTTELTNESVLTRATTSDDVFGVRVLISAISSYVGNYGGIAYVGVFDSASDYYKPALVFPERLSNSEKYIAEACSHEAGHTLGLSHDGTSTGTAYYLGQGSGECAWAPIMGAGYYKNLSQWSKGEYANPNNTEDDLAVMQNNGLPFRADDHGNTRETATTLPTGTSLQAWGLIGFLDDVDMFHFVAGPGPASLLVSPAALGPNLDVALELRDAQGALILSAAPTATLSASLSTTLAGGDYYLVVRGSGNGDPLTTGYTRYGSAGQYLVTGTVVAPAAPRTLVPPVAVVKAASTTGTAPLTISLDGSGSYDADGTLTSWVWSFGDGTQASGAVVSHTYANAGSYSAMLTVTDNDGLSTSATTPVQIQTATVLDPRIRIGSIRLTVAGGATAKAVCAVVQITTPTGAPVPGVTVKAAWDGLVVGTSSVVTDANGNATMTSKRTSTNGTITFRVTDLIKTGSTYASSLNVVSSGSVTVSGLPQ